MAQPVHEMCAPMRSQLSVQAAALQPTQADAEECHSGIENATEDELVDFSV